MKTRNGERGSILIYGPTKIGKTLDACFAFRTKSKQPFVLLSEPLGLDSVESNLGWELDHHELVDLSNPFTEAMQVLDKRVIPNAKAKRYSCVILDTGSELASRFLDAHAQFKTENPLKLYPVVTRQVRMVVRKILTAGLWCVMICHEQEPRDNELSGFRRGGPKLPGNLVEEMPSQFSMILRAGIEVDDEGEKYHRVYRCEPLNPRWVMGDRYGVAKLEQEMDLRKLLFKVLNPGAKLPNFPPKPIRNPGD